MKLRTRVCILFVIVTITVIFTCIYLNLNVFDYPQVQRLSRNPDPLSIKDFGDAAVENEPKPTCNIPKLDPYAHDALRLIAEDELEESKPKCMDRSQVRFTVDDSTSSLVQVGPNKAFWENLSCCFVGFRLDERNFTGFPPTSASDKKEWCIPLHLGPKKNRVPDIYDFVDVQCRDEDSLEMIYQDQFLFLRVDPRKEVRSNFKVRKPARDLLNIIFIGLDSVSHVNVQRFMPKTRSYLLKNLSAIEFWGRNVVSWGTQGNLLSTLTGCRLGSGMTMNPESYAEDCRLIWTHFAELGYRTFQSVDEDALERHFYPTLRENRTGSPEMDYDWLPYLYEMQRRNKMNGDQFAFGCFDHQWVQHLVLRHVAQVARHYGPNNWDKPFFSFTMTATTTHDVIGYTRFMDEPFHELFKELHENNLLNNTALIFMSDHGMIFGSYSRTHKGSTEFRMPFLYMVLPEWFRNKYSVATRTLRGNSHRLSTPFDLHETLLDLLDPEHRISKPEVMKPSKNSGISLFHPLPLDRTCESANIPFQYCICYSREPIANPDQNRHVVRIAQRLVAYLNEELRRLTECARLRFDKIILAKKYYSRDMGAKSIFYDVLVYTLPNRATFEASAGISENGSAFITGRVLRVNAYTNESYCLDKYGENGVNWIRSACYCIQ